MITTKELAKIVDLSPNRVRQLAKGNMPNKYKKRRYGRFFEFTPGAVKWIKNRKLGKPGRPRKNIIISD